MKNGKGDPLTAGSTSILPSPPLIRIFAGAAGSPTRRTYCNSDCRVSILSTKKEIAMAEKIRLPFKASEYIRNHFREDFLLEVKNTKQIDGRRYYTVEVTKDDYIHTLRFDEHGVLVKKEEEEAFPTDMHEARGPEDIP